MPFRLFHDFFPKLAERETRSITVLPGSADRLPAGSYGFLEMFCDEPRCDCRRVFFMVVASFRKSAQATIAWGWESRAFYLNWMRHGSEEDAACLQGPILNLGSPTTDLSDPLLELCRDTLLADPDYIDRVKRHYRMFRERVDRQHRR